MYIILLSGWAGSGKDTVGDILCKNYGFVRAAVADAMKKEVNEVFKIPYEIMNTQEGKASKITLNGLDTTVREVIISYAMSKRAIDPDHWIKALIKDLSIRNYSRIVITDFRFVNEHERIVEKYKDTHQIFTIRVTRLHTPIVESKQSENVLDGYTFTAEIDNTKDKKHLLLQVNNLMKEVGI